MKMLNCDKDCEVTVRGNQVIFESYQIDDFYGCIESLVVFDLLNLKSFLDNAIESQELYNEQ